MTALRLARLILRLVMHVWSKTVTTFTAEPCWNCFSRLSTSGPVPRTGI